MIDWSLFSELNMNWLSMYAWRAVCQKPLGITSSPLYVLLFFFYIVLHPLPNSLSFWGVFSMVFARSQVQIFPHAFVPPLCSMPLLWLCTGCTLVCVSTRDCGSHASSSSGEHDIHCAPVAKQLISLEERVPNKYI